MDFSTTMLEKWDHFSRQSQKTHLLNKYTAGLRFLFLWHLGIIEPQRGSSDDQKGCKSCKQKENSSKSSR